MLDKETPTNRKRRLRDPEQWGRCEPNTLGPRSNKLQQASEPLTHREEHDSRTTENQNKKGGINSQIHQNTEGKKWETRTTGEGSSKDRH